MTTRTLNLTATGALQHGVHLTGRELELKTDPALFDAVVRGHKTHEIRLNDRNYQVGDVLLLRRTRHTGEEMHGGAPLAYTGQQLRVLVTHVLEGYGLMPGWVILSVYVMDTFMMTFQYEGAAL